MFLQRNRYEEPPSALETEHRRKNDRKVVWIAVIFVLAAILAFGSIFLSQIMGTVTPSVTWDVLVSHLTGGSTNNSTAEYVVWETGVPRAIMGIFVGAGLAIGGAVMQSLMRNPLADPYTTGVASGAAFGAALMITMGISIIPVADYNLSITLNAFILALIPTAAIVAISRRRSITPTTMILAGVAIMYVFRASTNLMMMITEPDAVSDMYIWTVGSLGPASWDNVWIVAGVTVVCAVVLSLLSRQVNLMTTGDKSAKSMGVNVRVIRTVCLVVIAIMTAVIVAYTGTIGFMGLMAPHIARIFVGSDVKYLVPCSAAIGALFLIGVDCVAQTIIGIPVGVLTAIIGGPIFIILLIRGARKVWYRRERPDRRS